MTSTSGRASPSNSPSTTRRVTSSSGLAAFVSDESEGKAETRAFLDRRIEEVMKFEKAKAQWLQGRERFDVMRFLGRLRYPAR